MTKPKPLDEFMEALLASKEIQDFIKLEYGKQANAKLAEFRSGDTSELRDLIEDNKQRIGDSPTRSLTASGPTFLEIWQLGPLFWVRAKEFDDTGYFESLEAALDYVREQFGSFTDDDDESVDEDSDEDEE
jgi:hypothetical protein